MKPSPPVAVHAGAGRRRAAGVLLTLALVGVAIVAAVVLAGNRGVAPPALPEATTLAAAVAETVAADAVASATDPIAVRASAVPTGELAVRVADELGRPIDGAVVRLYSQLATWSEPALAGAAAVTGDGGCALLRDVPAGEWFVIAEHGAALFSWSLQPKQGATSVQAGRRAAADIVLGEPWVMGVRVVGGDVIGCTFERSGAEYFAPDARDGRNVTGPVLERLAARWPGAQFVCWLRHRRAAAPPAEGRCGIRLAIAGREPWQGDIEPTPLRSFAGPLQLDAGRLARSDAFGRVTVQLLDGTGSLAPALTVSLSGQLHGLTGMRIDNGTTRTVPSGQYRLSIQGEPFVRRLWPASVHVGRGGEVVLHGGERLWSRCVFTIAALPGVEQLRFEHAAMPARFEERQLAGPTEFECWVPEGRLRVTPLGKAWNLGIGRSESGVLAGRQPARPAWEFCVGGGTVAAPQRLELAADAVRGR